MTTDTTACAGGRHASIDELDRAIVTLAAGINAASYDLLVLIRVAGRGGEDELVAFAMRSTAAQVEERCRELRHGSPGSIEQAQRAHARRAFGAPDRDGAPARL